MKYALTEIRTNNPDSIVDGNHRKTANLNKLYSSSTIWDIPYRVFYMSCNLEHVLYDKLNCSDEEKRYNALQFARKYRNDLVGFLAYISTSDFSVMKGYKDSWEFIKDSLHSLERYTNFGLLFSDSAKD